MRLRVLHDTHYVYDAPVHALAMEARLQPCTDDYQSCQRHRLTITPKATVQEFNTFSDITVHYWTMLRATDVRITSESLVDTRTRPLLEVEAPPVSLDDVINFAYVQTTPLTASTPAVSDYAQNFAQLASEDWFQTALAVREHIYQMLDYEPNQTTTDTTAAEVLKLGIGVCQDFTHLMIATLRTLGIPARYTSGYLNQHITRGSMSQSMSSTGMSQSMDAGRPTRGNTASHAWVEVFLGAEHGWRGFDPTNNLYIDENYVRIGAGRDFTDVTPLKGVHRGPAEERMDVTVSVTPL